MTNFTNGENAAAVKNDYPEKGPQFGGASLYRLFEELKIGDLVIVSSKGKQ